MKETSNCSELIHNVLYYYWCKIKWLWINSIIYIDVQLQRILNLGELISIIIIGNTGQVSVSLEFERSLLIGSAALFAEIKFIIG